jgi:hypothetical protein
MDNKIFSWGPSHFGEVINDNTAIHLVLSKDVYGEHNEIPIFTLDIEAMSWSNSSFKTSIHINGISESDMDYLINGMNEIKDRIALERARHRKLQLLLEETKSLKNELNTT